MRLVFRVLGGGVVAACALSLSGAAALPAPERIAQLVPTVASVTRVGPDGVAIREPDAELTNPADDSAPEDSVVTAELVDDGVLIGDESQANFAISPRDLVIPELVLEAYQQAADDALGRCGLRWEVLAGIGKIESNHARGGQLAENGDTLTPIVGPVLNGAGPIAAISDTDGGEWDGDAIWDRAVGPMQFIPGSWSRFGVDGNDDGVADPHNIWDSTASAAAYLCAGGADLSTDAGLRSALLRYNRSTTYVANVIRWINAYAGGQVATTGAGGGGGSSRSTDRSGDTGDVSDPGPVATPTAPPSSTTPGGGSTPPDGGSVPRPGTGTPSTPSPNHTPGPVPSPSLPPTPTETPTETPTPTPTPTDEPPELVEVPQVADKTPAEAAAALKGAGFTVVIETVANPDVPEGDIIRTEPAGGTSVEPGSTVTIIVSTGPAIVAVPDVVDLTRADAEADLEEAGLQVEEEVKEEASSDIEAGRVIRTEPASGEQVERGSTVTLVISTGAPEPSPTPTSTDGEPARETEAVRVEEDDEGE